MAVPSPYNIEALEPTQVLGLSHAALLARHKQFPQIQPLLNGAVSCLFAIQSRREATLLSLSPQARYQAFLADHSALAERLPSHHVASYLGISNTSLSRIRARLGMANQGRSGRRPVLQAQADLAEVAVRRGHICAGEETNGPPWPTTWTGNAAKAYACE